MRIFNNMNGQIQFDLTERTQIVIPGKSFSGNFIPNPQALDKLIMAFTPEQIAFVVTGPSEYAACTNTKSTLTVNFIVNSMDEAIEKFGIGKEEKKEDTVEEEKPEIEVEAPAPESEPELVLKEKVIEESIDDVKEDVTTEINYDEVIKDSKKKSKKTKKE